MGMGVQWCNGLHSSQRATKPCGGCFSRCNAPTTHQLRGCDLVLRLRRQQGHVGALPPERVAVPGAGELQWAQRTRNMGALQSLRAHARPRSHAACLHGRPAQPPHHTCSVIIAANRAPTDEPGRCCSARPPTQPSTSSTLLYTLANASCWPNTGVMSAKELHSAKFESAINNSNTNEPSQRVVREQWSRPGGGT